MLLSIVTINYNNAAGLDSTFHSVGLQTFKDFELVVIDGGSTDRSSTVIDNFKNEITYSISEKDNGIYHAMNKGIEAATGEYLFFLNSGDTFFEENTLEKIVPYLKNSQLVYGNILISEQKKQWIKYYNEKLDFEYFTRDTLPHQGSFIKRSLFREIGMYDQQLRIVSDWKFFLQAICLYGVSATYINQVISIYDYAGISSRPEYYALQNEEKEKVLNELFPLHIQSIRELHSLRERKKFYESFQNDFFVQKYFGAKLKWKSIKHKFKR